MITCFIRYELDPYKLADFEAYARVWHAAIPRCGGDLVGYFAPHEGSNTTAYALINFDSLASYEAYRARLREDAECRANFEFNLREQFISKEERLFLRPVSGPYTSLPPATQT
jgi:hypothetical protein